MINNYEMLKKLGIFKDDLPRQEQLMTNQVNTNQDLLKFNPLENNTNQLANIKTKALEGILNQYGQQFPRASSMAYALGSELIPENASDFMGGGAFGGVKKIGNVSIGNFPLMTKNLATRLENKMLSDPGLDKIKQLVKDLAITKEEKKAILQDLKNFLDNASKDDTIKNLPYLDYELKTQTNSYGQRLLRNPNFDKETTVLGKPFPKDSEDPLRWAETSKAYGGISKRILEKNQELNRPMEIHTASDLIMHDDYLNVIPQGSKIYIYTPRNSQYPLVRLERARDKLRENGFTVVDRFSENKTPDLHLIKGNKE